MVSRPMIMMENTKEKENLLSKISILVWSKWNGLRLKEKHLNSIMLRVIFSYEIFSAILEFMHARYAYKVCTALVAPIYTVQRSDELLLRNTEHTVRLAHMDVIYHKPFSSNLCAVWTWYTDNVWRWTWHDKDVQIRNKTCRASVM